MFLKYVQFSFSMELDLQHSREELIIKLDRKLLELYPERGGRPEYPRVGKVIDELLQSAHSSHLAGSSTKIYHRFKSGKAEGFSLDDLTMAVEDGTPLGEDLVTSAIELKRRKTELRYRLKNGVAYSLVPETMIEIHDPSNPREIYVRCFGLCDDLMDAVAEENTEGVIGICESAGQFYLSNPALDFLSIYETLKSIIEYSLGKPDRLLSKLKSALTPPEK